MYGAPTTEPRLRAVASITGRTSSPQSVSSAAAPGINPEFPAHNRGSGGNRRSDHEIAFGQQGCIDAVR